ncbi:hypothetical protein [Micrococcus luteus]|uniref:hypothetical protein n=1 Tax=Micrococcus luteus TaxID=1270 RepID=UPI0010097518|nr:hypothetical protein [Micrococcus luteus]QAV29299.1 hypothetical protein MT1254_08245 [Micrococcus luteus]
MTADATDLVHVVTLAGQDYEDAVAAAEARGGCVDAVAEHLAQWDQGAEADEAARLWLDDMPALADLQRQPHQLHATRAGGLDYLVQINHQLGLYALYRPALTEEAAA